MIRNINPDVCMRCGICAEFCPRDVIEIDSADKARIAGDRGEYIFLEDFPERDDANRLKWIIAQKGNDGEAGFLTWGILFDLQIPTGSRGRSKKLRRITQ